MPETGRRIVQALPAIAFAIVIVSQGGIVFALGLAALGVVALAELYKMMQRARPVNLAGFLAVIALCLTALYGDKDDLLLVLVLSFPLVFFLAVVRPRRDNVSWGIAATYLGIVWIGLALSHAIFLRELDHGGALLVDALIATFVGDSVAYSAGKAWGRRSLAPRVSPNKTWEGLLAGIVGGTLAFWAFEAAYQEFLTGGQALLIGLCVALAAPLGDLFESLVKRDFEVKDTGRLFGPHGGVLDRLDAVFFSVPVAYYVSVAVT